MAGDGCLMVMVIDVHPQVAEQESNVQNYLNACIAFANIHLAASVKNTLAVIAANHLETRFLYPQTADEKVNYISSRLTNVKDNDCISLKMLCMNNNHIRFKEQVGPLFHGILTASGGLLL